MSANKKIWFKLYAAFLLSAFVIFVMQCSQSNNSMRKGQNVSFKITISEGGGFTGEVKGYHLLADGTVQHWQQLPGQKERLLWQSKQDPATILKFKNLLEKSSVLDKEFTEKSNMTTTVTYVLPDTTYTWSWRGMGAMGNVPPEFRQWFLQITKFCQAIQQ